MKIAFLDRDGVINKDFGYVYKIKDFEFTDGCIDALKRLNDLGYQFIIVTNQSGIGRGYYSQQDYEDLTTWYLEQLQQENINILDVFYCPHSPEDNCDCRKPKPGLFFQAKEKFPAINFSESLMFGDKDSDIEAAKAAGVSQFFLVKAPETFNSVVKNYLKIENL
jgi:D-glycero-D-manno-heptose 1,7-bisphosphate phosphatase